MRLFILITFMVLQGASAFAQQAVPGFILRTDASIQESADRLEAELGDKAMVFEVIGNHEGHSMYLVLRGKTGESEIHLTESDYYVGVRGTATFLIGGELTEAENRPRKQIRGKGLVGGTSHKIGPGDVVHVPVNTPHHLVIEPGKPYMYLLAKLDEEPLN